MNAQALALLNDVGRLADEQGWQTVAEVCAELRSTDDRQVLLAFADGIVREPFEGWVRAQSGRTVVSLGLADLRQSPVAALRCARLVSVFATTALPTAADLQVLGQLSIALPSQARAVALILAANIATDNDVNSARKFAWGLFVPEPKPAWSGQALEPFNCFLWQSDAAAPWQPLAESRQQLAAFMTDSSAEDVLTAERSRVALQYAIGLAQEQADAAVSAAARQSTASAITDWHPAELGERLSGKVRPVLQEWLASSELEMRAAVQSVSDRLRDLAAMPDAGAAIRTRITTAQTESRTALQRHARNAAEAWKEVVERALQDVPWHALNGAQDTERTHLLESLALRADPGEEIFSWREPAAEPLSVNPLERLTRSGTPIIAAMTVTGAVAGAAWSGPIGAGVGALVGASGSLTMDQHLKRTRSERLQRAWSQSLEATRDRVQRLLAIQADELETSMTRLVKAQLHAVAGKMAAVAQPLATRLTESRAAAASVSSFRKQADALFEGM
jgi:gas vesicle protein